MSFTEFQQVLQHDYQEVLVINHVNISNKSFHMLEIAKKCIGYHLQPRRSAAT